MSEKNFTELTRGELVELIAEMVESNLCKHKKLMGIIDGDKEDVENMFVIKNRKDKYFVAKFEWTYYNDDDSTQLDWKQITKEEFRQYILDSLATRSLNELRLDYQVTKKDQNFIQINEKVEKCLNESMQIIETLDIEMIKRINKPSEIPNDCVYIGKVADKFDATFEEAHNIDSNISIWQNNDGVIILTEDVNKELDLIKTIAVKHLNGKMYVFKDHESEKELNAALIKLSEMPFEKPTN
ncbi:hypothetical protein NSQ62_07660 [Solibacillus sp. FSL H8-0523]|uniref:hypothetical protein n=1 Tax=Solibacillus sp. FSL H8-0523 TaxID=2954511 RepID=UPI003101A12A